MKVDQLITIAVGSADTGCHLPTAPPPHPAGRVAQVTQQRNSPQRGNGFIWFQILKKEIIARRFECLAKCEGRQKKRGQVCAFGRTPLSKRGRWAQLLWVGTQTTEVKVAQRGEGAGPASQVPRPTPPLPSSFPRSTPARSLGKWGGSWDSVWMTPGAKGGEGYTPYLSQTEPIS